MLKNDKWIAEQALSHGMIIPFKGEMVRHAYGYKVISFGLGSYGYDLRLSPHDFRVFRHIPGTIVNPKRFDSKNLEIVKLQKDDYGHFFIVPAHSYALGVSQERLKIPDNVTALFIGKSTYARTGLITNVTPAEAGWEGYLTLEMSNSSAADCRVYAGEGIVQALFFEGERCLTTYADRAGKYQNQWEEVTIARM